MTQEHTRERPEARHRGDHVETLTLGRQPTAVVRARVGLEEISVFLAGAYREVEALTGSMGVALVGPPFARFVLAGEGLEVEVEAGFPVEREILSRACVVASDLPGGDVACVLRRGTFHEVAAAYDEVEQWVRSHGCVRAGDPWEVYLDEPGGCALTLVYLPFDPCVHPAEG